MLPVFLLILLPLAGALAAWLIPSNLNRPLVLPAVGTLHILLTFMLLSAGPARQSSPWIRADAVGTLFLLVFSVIFAACAFYAVNYLRYRKERDNRVLCTGMQICLSAMTLAAVASHIGLLWLAIETTTLAMAPLVYFNRNARSIEATWKYMLVCSVGIALALLGILFLAYSTVTAGIRPSLLLDDLLQAAPGLPQVWLNAAFVLMLVGYGTKMGLAPMHTWKPDAYGEAPGLVGAMLAGGLANCGFLGLVRIYQICMASGSQQFYRGSLVGIGLLSLAVAAVFLTRQTDFKRMLAYSSVEHMGIFSVALGIGGKALYGAMLHLIGNGLAKGVLFLCAGNIHRAFASKSRETVHGTIKRAPWTGALFLAAFLAMTGLPPFLPFSSELAIFSALFSQGKQNTGIVMALLLMVSFLGMSLTVIPVVFGDPPKNRERTGYHETAHLVGPPLALLILLAVVGFWLPPPLHRLIIDAAHLLETGP